MSLLGQLLDTRLTRELLIPKSKPQTPEILMSWLR